MQPDVVLHNGKLADCDVAMRPHIISNSAVALNVRSIAEAAMISDHGFFTDRDIGTGFEKISDHDLSRNDCSRSEKRFFSDPAFWVRIFLRRRIITPEGFSENAALAHDRAAS